MNSILIRYRSTAIGELILGAWRDRLCLLDFRYRRQRDSVDRRLQQGLKAEFMEGDSPVLDLAERQLDEYLRRQREHFDIPLELVGSQFQRRVWDGLRNIAYGHTCSYIELARKLDCASAVRAVAAANGANAIAVIVPCHRVVGSTGDLIGYGGGLDVKRRLLKLESPDLFGSHFGTKSGDADPVSAYSSRI